MEQEIRSRTEAVSALIEKHLGVRGRGLEAKLRRAGRRMPKWVRREAQQLVAAEALLAHPKLMMQADPGALEQSFRKCETWLKSVDRGAQLKTAALGLLATNAFNLLCVGLALLVTLRLTGHL